MSHLTTKFKSTPTYTMKGRHQAKTHPFQPSPAAYQVLNNTIASSYKRNGKFGTSTRKAMNSKKATPGPGAYESTLPINNNSSFNKHQVLKQGQVRFREEGTVTPAPGFYKVNDRTHRSVPQFTINRSLRGENFAKKVGPSPDKYDPVKPKSKASLSVTIGNSKRSGLKTGGIGPGPAAYQNQKQFLSKSFNQKDQFAKQQRSRSITKLESLPGPAEYHANSSFTLENINKSRGFTLLERGHRHSASALIPGPGAYSGDSQNYKFKVSHGVTMATSKRTFLRALQRKGSASPGPGNYEPVSAQEGKFNKIGSSTKLARSKMPRFKSQQQIDVPFINPESLDVSRKSIPKYTLSQTQRSNYLGQRKKSSPAVFYDAKMDAVTPSHKGCIIPRSQRLKQIATPSKVGPGSYNIQPEPVTPSTQQRKSKFGRGSRKTFLDDVIRSKVTTFNHESYESREEFPNPPRYMSVHKKLAINEGPLKHY